MSETARRGPVVLGKDGALEHVVVALRSGLTDIPGSAACRPPEAELADLRRGGARLD